jgi:phospho-N-acetylmuramoyl-pentapeptide-transferase
MESELKVLIASFIITIIFALIIIPILKKKKVGQIERTEGPQSHLQKQGTPTMGGIIIALTMLIGGMILATRTIKIIPLVAVSIGFGLIGCIDDSTKLKYQNTNGISPTAKMMGLLVISVIYALFIANNEEIGTETIIPIIKKTIEIPILIYIPFSICTMLATTNAINLTDGIDGLSASVSMIIICCLTAIGILKNITEIALFGALVSGACLGFLMFNLHPAKVFMGDTGSLLLGGVIIAMALYLKVPLLLLVIAIIPVLETLSVIIQVLYFKKTGNRIFKMAPLHHHFELSGWNESVVVSVFSLVTLVASIIGIFII